MKVMITNDDGILAPGIAALTEAFCSAGYEVVVCAPDGQRSAASHSLSIGKPITVKRTQLGGAAQAYAISGTPADCVKLGLTNLSRDCEAVISGINRGYNVGTDILYSGTVAAAMEGAICGVPALAVSQPHECGEYTQVAAFAVQVFERMMAKKPAPYTVWNLNCPGTEWPKGLTAAAMEPLHYDETYALTASGEAGDTYVLAGAIDEGRVQSDDYRKLTQGYATLTVLRADLTDAAAQRALKMQL